MLLITADLNNSNMFPSVPKSINHIIELFGVEIPEEFHNSSDVVRTWLHVQFLHARIAGNSKVMLAKIAHVTIALFTGDLEIDAVLRSKFFSFFFQNRYVI